MAYRGTRVTVNIDRAKVRMHVGRLTEASARRASEAVQRRARNNIRRAGRINTGAMLNSIEVTRLGTSTLLEPKFRIGSDLQYARYQEHGIGPVYPVRAKVLRFKPKGSNTFVFARRTRGFEGAHFMRDAYRAITKQDFLP